MASNMEPSARGSAQIKTKRRVVLCNPNTTKSMTDALKPLAESLGSDWINVEYFTAPSGVPSINDEADAATSATACFPQLKTKLADFDAFLICCYSNHPLVKQLREEIANQNLHNKAVAGIFEASVATCLSAINLHDKFGIISTGKQWEEILAKAVADIMGSKATDRYAGCETTGLSADELHTTSPEITKEKIKLATKRLLGKKAKAICLGCAGMAGMDKTVRKACIEHLGENEGRRIKIVDGVISGICFLEVALRATQ